MGEMVYLKFQSYRHNALGLHNSLKLHSRFYGPYRMPHRHNALEKFGKVAYKLSLSDGCLIHPIFFYVSQLKKYVGSRVIPNQELPLVDVEGNILVEPVAVLERRVIPRNNESVVQWLVQWMNLPQEAATWEDVVLPEFHP